MGSGKTALAKALLEQKPELKYLYMSTYAVRIPMSLAATSRPDLLSLPKPEFIAAILANRDIDWADFTRQEMDDFGREIYQLFGNTIIAEVVSEAMQDGQYVLDNVLGVSNVTYFKERRVYIVNLHCSPETQLQRRLRDRKNIDPAEGSSLEEQIRKSNEFFEIDDVRALAHVVYDTDAMTLEDYADVAREVLARICVA